ncbi:GMC oxidoreductase [Rhizosaccharibacter radicis]|uniref:Cholesterol oxidase n=1 Tax=Rhizosaccharibacter radicis TaxID=2782605 RepID=A0ABT1VTW2_9PROT|nr:GMC family oxidoreductase [Acetobacteraceae bacterium KSS12]
MAPTASRRARIRFTRIRSRRDRRDDYDVLVIGSGFGGSTATLRLTEKGYRVGVLEAGRRFNERNLPRTTWDLRSFLWMPALGFYGIQRVTLLHDVLILSGAGVGGGSLNYAQTLYRPPASFFADPHWGHITDWQDELEPFYDQASRMLGKTRNPTMTPADEVMLKVAEDMGVGHTFRQTDVGVFFGEPGVEVEDPYFGGVGPRRKGCIQTGECMLGCRHNAKNTLNRNYLFLAEHAGAEIHPLTTVTAIRPLADGGWAVDTVPTGGWLRRLRGRKGWRRRTFRAREVVLAAGTLGTQTLLHRMREDGHLPGLSRRLGELTRTNSEAILGARTMRKDADYSRGVAISSSFFPDERTHVEPARYGRGSNLMGLLGTALADGGGSRLRSWGKEILKRPGTFLRALALQHWSEQSIIALVMQTSDNSLTCFLKRGLFGRSLTSRQGVGEPNPSWIPAGHEVVRRMADRMGQAAPFGSWGDLFNVPMTAHILGGAVIGETDADGVIDPYHRVHNHPGLHVVDGAAVSANLGVNPSLTITAQAERAMSFWPNKGEADPRPAPGQPYRRLEPVAPHRPVVPAHAPGALRLRRKAAATAPDRVQPEDAMVSLS